MEVVPRGTLAFNLTQISQILSLDVNVFCAFRGFCVPFFPHTDFTDLTDFISLDVSLFCELRGFCVPFIRPTEYPCPSVASVCPFLSHTELTELTERI